MLEKLENKFVYEGIVAEEQGPKLCIKYKDWEAIEKNPRIISFFTKFRQKGYIILCDDDLKGIKPYSMEGKKVRVTIEILKY